MQSASKEATYVLQMTLTAIQIRAARDGHTQNRGTGWYFCTAKYFSTYVPIKRHDGLS